MTTVGGEISERGLSRKPRRPKSESTKGLRKEERRSPRNLVVRPHGLRC